MKRMPIIIALAIIATTATAQTFGAWEIQTDQDIMTQEAKYFMVNMAEAASGTLDQPIIFVRTDGDDIDLFIYWGGFRIGRESRTVATVLDSGEPQEIQFTQSSTGEAIFLDDVTLGLLLDADTVAMQVESSTGRRMVARWQLDGMVEGLAYIVDQM